MVSDFRERYGPTAVVTGASSGIGEQIARQLAARGLDLVLIARRANLLDQLAAELQSQHSVNVHAFAVDLTDVAAVDQIVAHCAGRNIGLVVSNAGLGVKGLHHKQDVAALADMVAVNCTAPTLLAHAFTPQLIERGHGCLLFVGSIESVGGFPFSAAYSASKAYVDALGEALWGELRAHGIDVVVIAPGSTETEIHQHQGIDTNALTAVMTPAAVATLALDHLTSGPHYTTGMVNKALVALLSAMPRRMRIRASGMGMRKTLQRSNNPRI
jgi:short-subunit dehydrogenase